MAVFLILLFGIPILLGSWSVLPLFAWILIFMFTGAVTVWWVWLPRRELEYGSQVFWTAFTVVAGIFLAWLRYRFPIP